MDTRDVQKSKKDSLAVRGRWYKKGSAARLGATNSATNQKSGPHKSMYFQLVMRLV